jgi:plastocyanin
MKNSILFGLLLVLFVVFRCAQTQNCTVPKCDYYNATVFTGNATITFTYPSYTPSCSNIPVGASVTFSGDFSAHPLRGGIAPTEDPSSPITNTSSGSTATFTFSNSGIYPFFCFYHWSFGMVGAIYVGNLSSSCVPPPPVAPTAPVSSPTPVPTPTAPPTPNAPTSPSSVIEPFSVSLIGFVLLLAFL